MTLFDAPFATRTLSVAGLVRGGGGDGPNRDRGHSVGAPIDDRDVVGDRVHHVDEVVLRVQGQGDRLAVRRPVFGDATTVSFDVSMTDTFPELKFETYTSESFGS